MNRYLRNSEWEKRLAGRQTRRESLMKVIGGTQSLRYFMKNYERLVIEYVGCLLIDHKEVADAEARSTASREIWEELIEALPAKLASEWGEGGVRFRDILREAVHEAHFSWSRPGRSEKAVSERIAQDEAWYRGWRSHLLRKAMERLKHHQRENEAKNIYFTIFCVWDEDHTLSHEARNDRLAARLNGRRLTPENFRKTLGRAWDLFGRYLAEAVKADYLDGDATIMPTFRTSRPQFLRISVWHSTRWFQGGRRAIFQGFPRIGGRIFLTHESRTLKWMGSQEESPARIGESAWSSVGHPLEGDADDCLTTIHE